MKIPVFVKLFGFVLFLLTAFPCKLYSQNPDWAGFEQGSIRSSMDNETQNFYFYRSEQSGNQPLVVSLHQWSADYKEYKNSMAPEVKARKWNYVHPDFRGANRHPKACGSDFVVADIDDVIDWALKNMKVDASRIYIVGASGGGYAALCSFMKSKHRIKEYSVWVPITDLGKWYYDSRARKTRYAEDIIRCTCEGCDEFDVRKAEERSPICWKTPVDKLEYTKLRIYAGIHDGYSGAVPITHSIGFYNKMVKDLNGGEKDRVSADEIIWLLTARCTPPGIEVKDGKLGDRTVFYKKEYGNISLTLFDGGHEILTGSVFP